MSRQIYVSVDIEADGPIPGPYSMLGLGAAAFDLGSPTPRVPISTFEAALHPLPEAGQDPDTMRWWATQPKAWAHVQKNCEHPAVAMARFVTWLDALPGKPVFVGYPVTFDFLFVYWYLRYYGHGSPFGFQGLDIKTLAMTKLNLPYKQCTKRRFPKRWFAGGVPHDHTALADAIGQGVLFVNIMQDG